MPHSYQLILQTVIKVLLAYWVYRDSKKKELAHKNIWIVVTVLFPPLVIPYFIYSLQASKKIVLSKKQQLEVANRKKTEQSLKEIALEKEALVKRHKEEMLKNSLTVQELEALKTQTLADKEKLLQELEKERKYQQELAAKQLHL